MKHHHASFERDMTRSKYLVCRAEKLSCLVVGREEKREGKGHNGHVLFISAFNQNRKLTDMTVVVDKKTKFKMMANKEIRIFLWVIRKPKFF